MQKRKIPTVLGIFIVIALVASIYLATGNMDKISQLLTKASASIPPSSPVDTANITDSSFTVFWTTDKPSSGAVFFGTTPELSDGVAVDERDKTGGGEEFQTHFVKVSGLKENTKYYFKIGQTDPSYGASDGSPLTVTTGPKLSSLPEVTDLSGKVLNGSNEPQSNAIAIWQTPGSTKVVALTKSDGTYSLPLSLARTTDLNSVFIPESGNPEKIILNSGSAEATINCQTGEVASLPPVKIGQTISCTDQDIATDKSIDEQAKEDLSTLSQDVEKDTNEASKEFSSFGSLLRPVATSSSQTSTTSINIEQGETVSSGLPTFAGKVGPKQIVKIEVHSEDVYSGTVIASPNGSWSWTPPANLTPGEHEVTITIVNANGTTQTVTRKFYVSGTGPIMPITNGTPSGQVSVTPIPLPSTTKGGQLPETGVELPTILALTFGILFTTLSAVTIFKSTRRY